MKKSALLITLLAGLATGASAASVPAEAPVLVLPTYVISAPRELPIERQIADQRDAFVRQALAPRAIVRELTPTPIANGQTLRVTEVKPAQTTAKARS